MAASHTRNHTRTLWGKVRFEHEKTCHQAGRYCGVVMSDLAAWLDALGLGKYAPAFAAQEVELADLEELGEDDLKEIGLPLGPRRRILKALRGAETPAPTSAPPAASRLDAERRQLTVMFVDLVGSTALSEELDPEDLAVLMRRFKETCAAAVTRFDGHIASYMGDGIMVYFGYPVAHEDDAERAIHASLQIIEAMPGIVTNRRLQARIGIATGLVVVGDVRGDGVAEQGAVLGETPNLAARLQSQAEPDMIVIAPVTRRLAGKVFEYQLHGTFDLKGFSEPVQTWRVTGVPRFESRFMADRDVSLNRMIARDAQFDMLLDRWNSARAGQGQVVLISGEAGIGKSRLTEGLRESLDESDHTRVSYQCSPYHTNSAFYPVIRQLERAAGFDPGDSDAIKLGKLETILGHPTDAVISLAAELMSLSSPGHIAATEASPQQRMIETQQMLTGQLIAVARQRPVLVVFEDAHWIDPTTRTLMDRIIPAVADAAILIVMTYRPEFDPGWGAMEHVTELPLARLDAQAVSELVAETTGGKTMPHQICELIAARTDGVPLYVEEVTRGLLESGLLEETPKGYRINGPLPALAVPNTLQDSLMARLDRLGTAKDVAQISAVFGRPFSPTMIEAVSDLPSQTLRDALDRLVAAEIIAPAEPDALGAPGTGETYTFRHALIRDTAYNSLLRSERQALHGQVAKTLLEQSGDLAESEPEMLAYHYSLAGLAEDAVPYWQAAGRYAVEHSANLEAVTHLDNALEQLANLPEGEARDRREIDIQVLRGGVLRSIMGIAAPETGAAYARIRALCNGLGETAPLFPVLNGLYAFHLVRAEYNLALDVARELLVLAEQSGQTQHRMVSHRAMGAVQLHIGHPTEARDHLQQALDFYDVREHGPLAYVYGTDHAAITSGFLSMSLWLLGQPDQALELQLRALTSAEELNHGHSIAQVLTYLCMIRLLRGEVDAVEETATRLADLSREQGFPFMTITANFWQGWANAMRSPTPEAIADLRGAAETWWSGGAGNYKPFFLTLIADALIRSGDVPAAIEVLAEARARQVETNEGWAAQETGRVSEAAQAAGAAQADSTV